MSSNGNHDQLKAIRDQAGTNTHRAKQYFNETFEQSPSHPAVTIYDKQRFDFFFEHTLTHFNFPSKSTIDESVLRDKGLNEFTRIFYDCFLRYNATFDMIPDANMGLRHDLKLLLLEINDYIVSENIEPLKEKYQDADVKLGLATSDDSTTAGRWQRNLVIYRDFVTTLDYFYHGYTYFVPDKNSSL